MNPYEVLGVDRNATNEQIKKAYRKVSKACHPDHHPNDEDAARRFRDLSRARDILLDPQKRQVFDETGSVDEADGGVNMAAHNLSALFMQFVENGNSDPLFAVRREIGRNKTRFQEQIERLDSEETNLRKVIKALAYKGKGSNFLLLSLESKLAQVDSDRAQRREFILLGDRMIALLDGYTFKVEKSEVGKNGLSVFESDTTIEELRDRLSKQTKYRAWT